jgi:hypothetical protein
MNVDGVTRFQAVPPRLSRRQFGRTLAGTAALGGALAAGLLKPAPVAAESLAPVPIPSGTPNVPGGFHFFGPASLDPVDAEPITITNFDGFVGLAYPSGLVTQTNTTTHETEQLQFLSSDMRFMTGNYRGLDGRLHHGTFALV